MCFVTAPLPEAMDQPCMTLGRAKTTGSAATVESVLEALHAEYLQVL